MPRIVKELSDMTFDEISLVDRGANPHAKIVFSKSLGDSPVEDELYDEGLDLDEFEVGDLVEDEDGNVFEVVFEDDYEDYDDDDYEDYDDDYEDYDEVGKNAGWVARQGKNLTGSFKGARTAMKYGKEGNKYMRGLKAVNANLSTPWKVAGAVGGAGALAGGAYATDRAIHKGIASPAAASRATRKGRRELGQINRYGRPTYGDPAKTYTAHTATGASSGGPRVRPVTRGTSSARYSASAGSRTVVRNPVHHNNLSPGNSFHGGKPRADRVVAGTAREAGAAYKGAAGKFNPKTAAIIGGGALGAAGLGVGASYLKRRRNQDVSKALSEEYFEELSKAMSDAERDTVRDEMLSKAFDELEYYQMQAYEAGEIAKAEADLRVYNEYVEVAKGYDLGIEDEELAGFMMRAAEVMDEGDQIILKSLMDTGTAAVAAYFNELGNEGLGYNSDVLQQVDYLVENDGIAKGYNAVDVFDANPELYDQYLYEMRGR